METTGEENKKGNINNGFVRMPQKILNFLLTNEEFTLRDLKLLLLVSRLTYGCHTEWATFALGDLKAIHIAPSHAGGIVKKAIKRDWIIRNASNKKQYKLNERLFLEEIEVTLRNGYLPLASLIGKNLFTKSSLDGDNIHSKMGNSVSPKKEYESYQKGNNNQSYNKDFQTQSNSNTSTDKDNDTKNIGKDTKIVFGTPSKGGYAEKFHFYPASYTPKDTDEEKAFETWKTIEPENPDSFGYYRYCIVEKQVPYDVIDPLVREIQSNPNIRHKGKFFVSKIEEYLVSEDFGGGELF